MTTRPASKDDCRKILLTRPGDANEPLAVLLEQSGYQVRTLPLLKIQPCPESPRSKQIVMNIDHYQQVICSSQHAARLLARHLDQYWPQMPAGILWHSLGKASALPLEAMGIKVSYPPTGHTSEDLLATTALTRVEGHKILLAKGEGGRTELAETLTQRGALVTSLDLYQRVRLDYGTAELAGLFRQWQPDASVLLSAETLEHLCFLGKKIGYPCNSILVIVPSGRVAARARQLGFKSKTVYSLDSAAILRVINDNLTRL